MTSFIHYSCASRAVCNLASAFERAHNSPHVCLLLADLLPHRAAAASPGPIKRRGAKTEERDDSRTERRDVLLAPLLRIICPDVCFFLVLRAFGPEEHLKMNFEPG